MKKIKLFGGLMILALTANAQSYKEDYVDWGKFSTDFVTTMQAWSPGREVTADDNFFISRVKPKERFRNAATQVDPNITEANDKKLLFWVPIDDAAENAMPNGVYDSEVFNMWQYITHYGNWTAPLGRIPGNFADVAHKNGVAVSSVAGVPNASLDNYPDWKNCLTALGNSNVDQCVKFLRYYGNDGLGYNSEFYGGGALMPNLINFHKQLQAKSKEFNPVFNNVWYDGTNDTGGVTFDGGYGSHNDDISDGAVLFFNYNWSRASLLQGAVSHANSRGYNPLDIYAGMNMQGGEPKNGVVWTLLKDYPISIGLWGAHSQNMFWESRGELGGAPESRQRTYQLRTERWFTGGTRNPVNCPAVGNSLKYHAENYDFQGMSPFISAKSTLSWDLATEPFITYFNLGNGKFFNWMGERQHDKEWYNIGVQDYLPTWRWWFTKTLLGRDASDVAENGLDAEFSWDDAYVGGSTVRIFGSTTEEYLHLFKTKFQVNNGDVITLRYKLAYGNADMNLVLTATGAESTPLSNNLVLCTKDQFANEDRWIEKKFTVGEDISAAEIALVALQIKNADNASIFLGEFSIIRGTFDKPERPNVKSSKTLMYGSHGIDGKIIFEMPNNKDISNGEPCYNIDVKTSLFKIYAQQANCEKVLMGITTSWAGLVYSMPLDLTITPRVRFGVSAVSLDMKSESNIRWGEYETVTDKYTYNDDIQINKTTIKPNEDFEISYIDLNHEKADWTITDQNGNVVKSAQNSMGISVPEGLAETGNYSLTVNGNVYNEQGSRVKKERVFSSYIQISSKETGALPKILTLTANGNEADIYVDANETVELAYTGREANGIGSQAVDLGEARFGARCNDLGINGVKSFSTAFWLKINKLDKGDTQLFSVANKVDDPWPKTDWGWIWVNIKEDGSIGNYTFRGTDASNNNELAYYFENSKLPIGSWVHVAFVFDYNATGSLKSDLYINGVKQEITSWSRGSGGHVKKQTAVGYQGSVYNITANQILAVGGDAFNRNGINGAIDNLQIWEKAMTAEDVKASMGNVRNNPPEGLIALWDMETPAGDDLTFKSVGVKGNVSAGRHAYKAEGAEGQGVFKWLKSDYTSGCPFIQGTGYKVETLPSWKTKGATIQPVTGNDKEGSATVQYAFDGDYAVTLTLENSLGYDQKTYQMIKVGASVPEGIDDVANNELAAYAIDGIAVVEFAKEGNYNVSLYNVAGQKVAGKSATVAANDKMHIVIENKGTYVLVIEEDGKPVRSVKLFNK
ncbi:MAG: hypothetical protein J6V20_01125 [Bacteroidaceae bacterium]|nr:hypothetical protein [Bacteroidaceae bacterium]